MGSGNVCVFFFSSRRRHTRCGRDWSSDVCSSDLFRADTKADVVVEYQQWANHLTKLDAALAGSDAPDVIELGNTEAAKYVFNGGFADITKKKSSFENSDKWLTGLSA